MVTTYKEPNIPTAFNYFVLFLGNLEPVCESNVHKSKPYQSG